MIWLAVAEGAALCVLALVVVALAHSYAGLAARVEEDAPSEPHRSLPAHDVHDARVAPSPPPVAGLRELVGTTPLGEHVSLPVAGAARDTLARVPVEHVWLVPLAVGRADPAGARVLPRDVRLVVVAEASSARASRRSRRSPRTRASVEASCMSTATWRGRSRCRGRPYFVLARAASAGEVVGEGTATSWHQVVDLTAPLAGDERRATSDAPPRPGRAGTGAGGRRRPGAPRRRGPSGRSRRSTPTPTAACADGDVDAVPTHRGPQEAPAEDHRVRGPRRGRCRTGGRRGA